MCLVLRLIIIGFLFHWIPSFAQTAISYKVEEVIDSSAYPLSGTLLIPSNSKSVILFIAGSGATDRNGNSVQLKSNCTKLLAEELAALGIASLRYDKRGVGDSKRLPLKEEDVSFETVIEDTQRWIRWLKNNKRFKNIIIAGHSEGSLIGMVAAKRENASAFISLAGAGRPIDEVIKEQVSKNPYNPPEVLIQVDSIFKKLRTGKPVNDVPLYLMTLFRPSVQPYFISWLQYNPQTEIAKLSVPVMIIQGTTDIQVSMRDSELLKGAAPKATYMIIDGMNHIFKDAPASQLENIATYSKPELPLSKNLVPTILDFIKSLKP